MCEYYMDNNFSIFDLERRKWELSRSEREQREETQPSQPTQEAKQEPAAMDPASIPSATNLLDCLMDAVRDMVSSIKTNETPDGLKALGCIRDIIESKMMDRVYEHACDMDDLSESAQLVAVTALTSMRIGAGLGYTPKRLIYLGMAGLLHNAAIHRMPDRLFVAGAQPTPQDKAKLRTQPHMSAQILERMGKDYEWLREVALQSSERVDGTGYPNGLQGKEISGFAAIVGLVSYVLSLRQPVSGGNRFIQTDAIKRIVDFEKDKFPRRILKEFLDQISLFPVNTYIRLNNQSIGRVVSSYKSQPMRPTIELLQDGLGKRIEPPKIIHLSGFPLLHIVAALDPEDEPMLQIKRETSLPEDNA